jgi:hypothetical protein
MVDGDYLRGQHLPVSEGFYRLVTARVLDLAEKILNVLTRSNCSLENSYFQYTVQQPLPTNSSPHRPLENKTGILRALLRPNGQAENIANTQATNSGFRTCARVWVNNVETAPTRRISKAK